MRPVRAWLGWGVRAGLGALVALPALVVCLAAWGQPGGGTTRAIEPAVWAAARQVDPPPTGAEWELRALGVSDEALLAAMAGRAGARTVTLAIVGQGGVSKALLEPLLVDGNTLEYRMWPEGQPSDPGADTHDTQAARVILDLTTRLGITLHILVYQPGEATESVAEAFSRAGHEADIVALYQSFWGNVAPMGEAIAASPDALFISPYVQVGETPTSTCLQDYAAKPWGDGVSHFVTVIPAARQEPGVLLTPLARPEDTETISFVAPSYYASGAGGTCPSAEVAAAVAAYIVAASEAKPSPSEIVALMRETSCLDREALGALPEFTEDAVSRLEAEIARLHEPPEGARPKLASCGLLSLRGVFERLHGEG